jgi:hypothetical protein
MEHTETSGQAAFITDVTCTCKYTWPSVESASTVSSTHWKEEVKAAVHKCEEETMTMWSNDVWET